MREQLEKWPAIDPGKPLGEFHQHAFVLPKDCGRINRGHNAVVPGVENSARRSTKENARHEDVRVEDDSHRALRTLAMACLTWRWVKPAMRAWRRASRIRRSNCLHDGEFKRWKTSTSSLATTTNSAPGSS